MSETKMTFAELSKVNVNEHIDKKGNLSYLSWAWAVDYMTRLDPDATWEYREWDGKPYLTLPDCTCLVYCSVTFGGKTKTAQLPVMDHRNKPIANPDAFQINTAMQRALVKAIALHGLGLYIYAGEDLPKDEADAKEKEPEPDPEGAALLRGCKTLDELADIWRSLKPAQRATLGKLKDELKVKILTAEEATQA